MSYDKVEYMELYRTIDEHYILVLGHHIAEVAHVYSPDSTASATYRWTFTDVTRMTKGKIPPMEIDEFKYIENLKKFCSFAVKILDDNTSDYNETVKEGVGVVVDILISKHIRPEQIELLNELYGKLNKNREFVRKHM